MTKTKSLKFFFFALFDIGLDAAAPNFENYDAAVKLDPTDATFVDLIHTDIEPMINGGMKSDLADNWIN